MVLPSFCMAGLLLTTWIFLFEFICTNEIGPGNFPACYSCLGLLIFAILRMLLISYNLQRNLGSIFRIACLNGRWPPRAVAISTLLRHALVKYTQPLTNPDRPSAVPVESLGFQYPDRTVSNKSAAQTVITVKGEQTQYENRVCPCSISVCIPKLLSGKAQTRILQHLVIHIPPDKWIHFDWLNCQK